MNIFYWFEFQIILLAILLLGQTQCNPVKPTDEVTIDSYKFLNSPDGGYEFFYKLSDESYRRESARQKEIDGVKVLSITGEYGFVGDDGSKYDVYYNAGEQGFVTQKDGASMLPEQKEEFTLPSKDMITENQVKTLVGRK